MPYPYYDEEDDFGFPSFAGGYNGYGSGRATSAYLTPQRQRQSSTARRRQRRPIDEWDELELEAQEAEQLGAERGRQFALEGPNAEMEQALKARGLTGFKDAHGRLVPVGTELEDTGLPNIESWAGAEEDVFATPTLAAERRRIAEEKAAAAFAKTQTEARQLSLLNTQRGQLASLATQRAKALKDFDKANGFDWQDDGTGNLEDYGAMRTRLAQLERRAQERVGTLRGMFTSAVGGEPTEEAQQAQAELQKVQRDYQLMLERRNRLAAERDQASQSRDRITSEYQTRQARRLGLMDPSVPGSEYPVEQGAAGTIGDEATWQSPDEGYFGAVESRPEGAGFPTEGRPSFTPPPALPPPEPEQEAEPGIAVPTPAELIRLRRRADELQATLDGAGDNLDVRVRDRLTGEIQRIRSQFQDGFEQQNPTFQKRITDMFRDPTLGEKIGAFAANVAEGAGTALVDTGEFLARNALKTSPLGLVDAATGGGLQRGVRDFSEAMRETAQEWGPDVPQEVRQKLEEDFVTGDVARGAGSSLGFMAPSGIVGGVGKLAGLSERALARLATASVATTGAAASGNSFRREAEQALQESLENGEINEGEYARSLGMAELFGTAMGTTEAMPLSNMVKRVGQLPGGESWLRNFLTVAGRGGAARAAQWVRGAGGRALVDALAEAGEEAGQELFQAVSQDLYASQTFDPDREVGAGAARGAGVGGVTGAVMSILASALGARRGRRPPPGTTERTDGMPEGPEGDAGATVEPPPGSDEWYSREAERAKAPITGAPMPAAVDEEAVAVDDDLRSFLPDFSEPPATSSRQVAPVAQDVSQTEDRKSPAEEMRDLADQTQREAGWDPAWPFIPQDLGNRTFLEGLIADSTLTAEEKKRILDAARNLGVGVPDLSLEQIASGELPTTEEPTDATIEREQPADDLGEYPGTAPREDVRADEPEIRREQGEEAGDRDRVVGGEGVAREEQPVRGTDEQGGEETALTEEEEPQFPLKPHPKGGYEDQLGRRVAFDSASNRFRLLPQGRSEVDRQSHTLEDAGSTPAPAPTSEDYEAQREELDDSQDRAQAMPGQREATEVEPTASPEVPIERSAVDDEYDASLERFRAAARKQAELAKRYRAKQATDEEFLAGVAEFKQAQAEGDKAEAAYIEAKNRETEDASEEANEAAIEQAPPELASVASDEPLIGKHLVMVMDDDGKSSLHVFGDSDSAGLFHGQIRNGGVKKIGRAKGSKALTLKKAVMMAEKQWGVAPEIVRHDQAQPTPEPISDEQKEVPTEEKVGGENTAPVPAAGAGAPAVEDVPENVQDHAAVSAQLAPELRDLSGNPTGWRIMSRADGATLVSPDGKKMVKFTAEDKRSGSETQRQRAFAHAFAIDNPIAAPETPKGELVVKPLYPDATPAAPAEPALPSKTAQESITQILRATDIISRSSASLVVQDRAKEMLRRHAARIGVKVPVMGTTENVDERRKIAAGINKQVTDRFGTHPTAEMRTRRDAVIQGEEQQKRTGTAVVPTPVPAAERKPVHTMSRREMIAELAADGITETRTGGYTRNSVAGDLMAMVEEQRRKVAQEQEEAQSTRSDAGLIASSEERENPAEPVEAPAEPEVQAAAPVQEAVAETEEQKKYREQRERFDAGLKEDRRKADEAMAVKPPGQQDPDFWVRKEVERLALTKGLSLQESREMHRDTLRGIILNAIKRAVYKGEPIHVNAVGETTGHAGYLATKPKGYVKEGDYYVKRATQAAPAAAESPEAVGDRGYPEHPRLPKKGEGDGAERLIAFADAATQWKERVVKWVSTQPENRAIIWEEKPSPGGPPLVRALSRNVGDTEHPWRVTTFWRNREDTALMPSGHQVYKTRAEAMAEEGRNVDKFYGEMPKPVMTEQEIQGYKLKGELPAGTELTWYKTTLPIGELRQRIRGSQLMENLVLDSADEQGRIAFTKPIEEKHWDFLKLTPEKAAPATVPAAPLSPKQAAPPVATQPATPAQEAATAAAEPSPAIPNIAPQQELDLRLDKRQPPKNSFVGEFEDLTGRPVGNLHKISDNEWRVYITPDFGRATTHISQPLTRADIKLKSSLQLSAGRNVKIYSFAESKQLAEQPAPAATPVELPTAPVITEAGTSPGAAEVAKPAKESKPVLVSRRAITDQQGEVKSLEEKADKAAQINPAVAKKFEGKLKQAREKLAQMEAIAKPKKAHFQLSALPNGDLDLLNAIYDEGGVRPAGKNSRGEYDELTRTFTGTARILISKTGAKIDDLAQNLGFPDVEKFKIAVQRAVRAREQAIKQYAAEQKQQQDAVKEGKFLSAALDKEGRPKSKIGGPAQTDELTTGDRFKMLREPFEVVGIDEATGDVIVNDGPRFGIQRLPAGSMFYPDKRTLQRVPRAEATWLEEEAEPVTTQEPLPENVIPPTEIPYNLAGEEVKEEKSALEIAEDKAAAKAEADKQIDMFAAPAAPNPAPTPPAAQLPKPKPTLTPRQRYWVALKKNGILDMDSGGDVRLVGSDVQDGKFDVWQTKDGKRTILSDPAAPMSMQDAQEAAVQHALKQDSGESSKRSSLAEAAMSTEGLDVELERRYENIVTGRFTTMEEDEGTVAAWRKANPKAPEVEIVNDPEWLENGRGVRGQYRDGRLIINTAYAGNVESVANHEWAHDTLASPAGRRAIAAFAMRELPAGEVAALRAKYAQQAGEGAQEHTIRIAEEFVAKVAETNPSLWRKVVEAVRGWLARRGHVTLTHEEAARALLRTLRKGELTGRGGVLQPARMALDDGAAPQSKGSPQSGPTNAEFQAWFKGSRITNTDGTPAVVWHTGIGHQNLRTKDFKGTTLSSENTQSQGIYFARDRSQSEGQYAGETKAYFLAIKNPWRGDIASYYDGLLPEALEQFNNNLNSSYDSWISAKAGLGGRFQSAVEKVFGDATTPDGSAYARAVFNNIEKWDIDPALKTLDLENEGYDGQDDGWQVVAFEPEQIRPATPNPPRAEGGAVRSSLTDEPAFRAWFGKSKVVDAQGRPMVVYHGTEKNFTVFDRSRIGSFTSAKTGAFWFTDSEDAAGYYSSGERPAMPVYLRMENPLIVTRDEFVAEKKGPSFWSQKAMQDENDGVVIQEIQDGDRTSTVFAVFEPTQIKSAIGNRGTFDPTTPDIRYSLTDEPRGAPPVRPKPQKVKGTKADYYRSLPDTEREVNAKIVRQIYTRRGQGPDLEAADAIIRQYGEERALALAMDHSDNGIDLPVKAAIYVRLAAAADARFFNAKTPEEKAKAAAYRQKLSTIKAPAATQEGQAIAMLAQINKTTRGGAIQQLIDGNTREQDEALGDAAVEAEEKASKVLTDAGNKAAGEVAKEVEKKIKPKPVTKSDWDLYREQAAQRMIDMVERRTAEPAEETEEDEKDPLQELADHIVAEMQRRITDRLPAKEGEPPPTPAELLREAIQNKDKYADVLTTVRNAFEEKYEAGSWQLDMIDVELANMGLTPYSQKILDKAIREAHKARQIRVTELARQHFTKTDAQAGELADALVKEAGVKRADAVELAAELSERGKKLVADARLAALERLRKSVETPKARSVVTAVERAVRLNNLGAFSVADLRKVVARELRLPNVTVAQMEHIGRLADAVETATTESEKARAVLDLLNQQRIYRGIKAVELATAIWYMNVLSGPMTHTANAIGNAANSFLQLGSVAIANPTRMGDALKGWMKGLETGWADAASVLTTGRGMRDFDAKTGIGNVLELMDARRDLPNLPKPAADAVNVTAKAVRYVGRAMKAMDALFYYPAKEAYTRVVAAKLLEADYKGKELAAKVREHLHTSPDAYLSAKQEADRAGLKGVERALRVAQIIEDRRAGNAPGKKAVEAGAKFALETTFNNDPTGWAGALYNLARKGTEEIKPGGIPILKAFLPFLRVPTNIFNASLNYSPVGIARAAIGTTRIMEAGGKMTKQELTDDERHRLWVQGLGGSLAMVALAALATAGDDEKEKWFDITATGPNDLNKRRQLEQTGWKAHSIKMGDAWISYKDTPLLIPLALIGNMVDAQRYRKPKEDLAWGSRAVDSAMSSVRVIFDTSMLSGLGNLMNFIQDKASPKQVAGFMTKIPADMVVPYSNALRQIDRAFNPEVREADGPLGQLGSALPFMRNTGPVRTDLLGQPVRNAPISRLGGMETNEPLREMLRDKRLFLSTPSKDTLIRVPGDPQGRPMTPDEYREFVRIRGEGLRRRLEPMADRLRLVPAERVQKLLETIQREESQKAKAQVQRAAVMAGTGGK